MTAPEVTALPSIQGEPYVKPVIEPMTVQEADEYVDSHSDGVNRCRASGNHDFPMPQRNRLDFDSIDEYDNFIAHYVCRSCGCAVRRDIYMAVRYGRQWRYERVGRTVFYQKNTRGETYLLTPGTGKGRPTDFANSLMTAAMDGQSPAALKKKLKGANRG